MQKKNFQQGHSGRLQTGEALLAAAKVVDTQLIKGRLTAFTEVHNSYAEAQRAVDEAQASVRDEVARLAGGDADQDDAIEVLALALAADRQARITPFAGYGPDSPSSIKQLSNGEKPKAIHKLAAAVQRDSSLSPASLEAAQTLDQAALAMEAALVAIEPLETSLREARHGRDAIGNRWDEALGSLKRGARAAADDGAPGLYTTLFGRTTRPAAKKTKPAPTEQPTPPDQAEQATRGDQAVQAA